MNYHETRKMFCLMPDDEIRTVIRVGVQVLQDRRRHEDEKSIMSLHLSDPVEFVDSKGWIWRGIILKINRKTVDIKIKSSQADYQDKILRVSPSAVKIITIDEFSQKDPMDLPGVPR
jgi:hypothetical protein